jgi:hypothetical protein
VNAPLVSVRVVRAPTSIAKRCVIRWSWSTTSNSPYFFSRSLVALDFGSVAV